MLLSLVYMHLCMLQACRPTSFEDFQELLVMRGIVSFRKNIFLDELCDRVDPVIILLQKNSSFSDIGSIRLHNKRFCEVW